MNFAVIAAVALGGALGAVSRYGVSAWVGDKMNASHWGIFAANIIGCLMIGALRAVVDQLDWGSETVRMFLFTGFIGSFTTFSTFESDIVNLWTTGARLTAFAYGSASVIGGLLAYLFAWWLTMKLVS